MPPEGEEFTVSFNTTHKYSVEILRHLEARQATEGYAILACLLTIGRLASPDELDEEGEVAFIQDAMDFVGAYWGEGDES